MRTGYRKWWSGKDSNLRRSQGPTGLQPAVIAAIRPLHKLRRRLTTYSSPCNVSDHVCCVIAHIRNGWRHRTRTYIVLVNGQPSCQLDESPVELILLDRELSAPASRSDRLVRKNQTETWWTMRESNPQHFGASEVVSRLPNGPKLGSQ